MPKRDDGDIWYLPFSLYRRFLEGKKMEQKCLDRMIDKYCKIITKGPGEARTHVIFGMIIGIDYDANIIIISSRQGVGCLNMKTVEAIRPTRKKS